MSDQSDTWRQVIEPREEAPNASLRPSPPSTDLAREAGKKCAEAQFGRLINNEKEFERIISEVYAPLEAELADWKDTAVERQKLCDDWAEKAQELEAELARVRQRLEQAKRLQDLTTQNEIRWMQRAEAAERKLAEHAEAERELLEAIQPLLGSHNNLLGAYVSCDGPPISETESRVRAAATHLRKLKEGVPKAEREKASDQERRRMEKILRRLP